MTLRLTQVMSCCSAIVLLWGCSGGSSSSGVAASGGRPGSGGSVGTGGSFPGSGGASTGSGGGGGTGGAISGGGGSGGAGIAGTGGGAAVGTGGAGPGSGGSGGGISTGGAASLDGGVDGGAPDVGAAPDSAAGSGGAGGGAGVATCGTSKPSLSGIAGTEGLVIGPDGTIYFSQPSSPANTNFIGRYRPPYAQLELHWADMKGGAFGIILDPKRGVIYAGSRPLRKLVKIVVADAPVVTNLVDVEPTINGVTLGEDSAVYYSDQGGGHIFRVSPEGVKTQVTLTPVSDANGLAFGPDGHLYVLTYVMARITSLTLSAGKETGRSAFATINGGRNADGIAFDAAGALYVTAGGLFKISADGQTQAKLPCAMVGSANVDFGVGALGCTDIYSTGSGGLNRCANDTPGMNVPWHRP